MRLRFFLAAMLALSGAAVFAQSSAQDGVACPRARGSGSLRHRGKAEDVTGEYQRLNPREKQALVEFLRTL